MREFNLSSWDFVKKYNKIIKDANNVDDVTKMKTYRWMGANDIYFLLRYILSIPGEVVEHPYVYQQCQFVNDLEQNRGGVDKWLFMWFREGYKSTILNWALNIQHMIRFPERTTLMLSNTNPGAKTFLSVIKQELENNEKLHKFYPEIFWEDPQRECHKAGVPWSLDTGITIKRKTVQKEPTIYTAGLLDSLPAKVHSEYLCYDDAVTEKSVETEHKINKTKERLELSFSLGSTTNIGGENLCMWFVGTRYDDRDAYGHLIDSGEYKVDIIPWHNGDGETPLAHSKAMIEYKKQTMSPYVFACQYELDPVAANKHKFTGDIHHYSKVHSSWDFILLCDPAGDFKERREHDPDGTAMGVIGRDDLGNEYLVDGIYDHIDLRTRITKMFEFIRRYGIGRVWYEKVSMQADVNEINRWKIDTGLHFTLNEFNPRKFGSKEMRIERTVMPRVENGILKFKDYMPYETADGKRIDLIADVLRPELTRFPHGKHDDFLDMLAQLAAVPGYGRKRIGMMDDDVENKENIKGREPRNPSGSSKKISSSLVYI